MVAKTRSYNWGGCAQFSMVLCMFTGWGVSGAAVICLGRDLAPVASGCSHPAPQRCDCFWGSRREGPPPFHWDDRRGVYGRDTRPSGTWVWSLGGGWRTASCFHWWGSPGWGDYGHPREMPLS